MELIQKTGGPRQDLHVSELFREIERQVLCGRPCCNQKVLLLLSDHHLRIGVIGVVYRKKQHAQKGGH